MKIIDKALSIEIRLSDRLSSLSCLLWKETWTILRQNRRCRQVCEGGPDQDQPQDPVLRGGSRCRRLQGLSRRLRWQQQSSVRSEVAIILLASSQFSTLTWYRVSLNIVFFLKIFWIFWTLQVLLQRWCSTHTGTGRKQSPKNILKSLKKHNI